MRSDTLTEALVAAIEPTLRRVVAEAVAATLAAPPGAASASPDLLTIPQAAAKLATSPATVRRMIACEKLPIVRLGRSVRVRSADLARLVVREH